MKYIETFWVTQRRCIRTCSTKISRFFWILCDWQSTQDFWICPCLSSLYMILPKVKNTILLKLSIEFTWKMLNFHEFSRNNIAWQWIRTFLWWCGFSQRFSTDTCWFHCFTKETIKAKRSLQGTVLKCVPGILVLIA